MPPLNIVKMWNLFYSQTLTKYCATYWTYAFKEQYSETSINRQGRDRDRDG
jgi:hypothetical protein